MIVECPKCGTKNSTDKILQPGRRYRCGQCGALITFTQTADTQGIFTEVPPEKAPLKSQEETKREQSPKKRKNRNYGCLGLLAVFFVIVVVINLFSSDDRTQQTPSTQTPTEQTTEATTTYAGVTVYHNKQPKAYGASTFNRVSLSNNVLAKNPTWEELVTFLELDDTDQDMYSPNLRVCAEFANDLHDTAEKAGIRAAWVALEFEDDSEGHAFNAFETIDKGLVYVDCTGASLGERFRQVLEASSSQTPSPKPTSQDKIAYVEIGKEYGLVDLAIASSPEYEFYLQYLQKTKDCDAKVEVLNTRIRGYNQKMERYNRDVNQYDLLVGGRTEISDSAEYEKLSSMYDELERRGLELDREEQHLDRETELLETELSELGLGRWEPLGIVKSIEIYW